MTGMGEDVQDVGRVLLVGVTVIVVLDRLAAASPEIAGLMGGLAAAMAVAVAILLSKPSF